MAGTAAQLTQVFGTTLRRVSSPDLTGTGRVQHRYREGRLTVPAELQQIVLAVLGLDDRPQVSPHFRVSAEAATPASYTPPQVARAYRFPAGTDGTAQTIAILEFGGGFSASDLQTYFSGLGLPVPSITAASADGATNAPGSGPSGADAEVLLDIEVAGAVAHGAAQIVLLRAQHGPGFRRCDQRGRACDARPHRHQHQLGRSGELLVGTVPHRVRPGPVGRGGARDHGDRGVRG